MDSCTTINQDKNDSLTNSITETFSKSIVEANTIHNNIITEIFSKEYVSFDTIREKLLSKARNAHYNSKSISLNILYEFSKLYAELVGCDDVAFNKFYFSHNGDILCKTFALDSKQFNGEAVDAGYSNYLSRNEPTVKKVIDKLKNNFPDANIRSKFKQINKTILTRVSHDNNVIMNNNLPIDDYICSEHPVLSITIEYAINILNIIPETPSIYL